MNYNIQGRQLQASGLYKQVKEVKKVNVYTKLLKVQTELKAPKKGITDLQIITIGVARIF